MKVTKWTYLLIILTYIILSNKPKYIKFQNLYGLVLYNNNNCKKSLIKSFALQPSELSSLFNRKLQNTPNIY